MSGIPSGYRFRLHARLAADSHTIGDMALCRVLLMNDSRFPWLVLVPRVKATTEVFELTRRHRVALVEEISECAKTLKKITRAEKINIAALGNRVSQLHVHVVARTRGDAAWPGPVWSHGVAVTYEPAAGTALIGSLRRVISSLRVA